MRLGRDHRIVTGMKSTLNILLLAGSAEAREIAKALVARGLTVTALVSEAPRGVNPMPVSYELMSFDDPDALTARMGGFDAVVDASHGFDCLMTRTGFAAASCAGLPFVRLTRDRWSLTESDLWRSAPNVRAAMVDIPVGARVFSAAGWASLAECAAFMGGRLFLRQTNLHDRPAPYPFVQLVFGDAPFTVASETALFKKLNIDTLLCRNLGGMPSRPKLDAAKALGLRVILIDPAEVPEGAQRVHTVAQVIEWIDSL